jgi:phospholipid/cholesterol/gamma-HCH transport system substrate-binding protein
LAPRDGKLRGANSMREAHVEFKVGLFMVAGAALFVAFLFVLGNWSFRSGYTVYADFDFSGNVQPGAPVKVSGITVGRVEDVSFLGGQVDPQTGRRVQVRVELWIEERAEQSIRSDAQFFINTAGVLGEQYVEIVPGHDWDHPALAPGTITVGVNPPRTDLVVARLYDLLDTLSGVMHDDRDKIRDTIEHGADAVDQVDAILSENRTRVPALLDSVTAVAQQAARSDLPRAVRDADTLMVTANGALSTTAPTADAFLHEGMRVMGLVTDQRVQHVIDAVDHAGGAAESANTLLDDTDGMVRDIRAGKGTLGALVARSDVYADLREMVRDLRANPWKLLWKE